ncbi:MAG: trigger factor, partial [Bacillota bacterium]
MAKLEELDNSRVKLTIEVSADQLEHGLEHAYQQIKDDVEVKGFRKGEVPRKVYEQQKGVETLYEEALNHVIQETYTDAVMEHGLAVVSQPKIDLDINTVEKGKPFTYTATVAVKPEVTLGQYKGLEYEKPSDEVTEEEVQDEIKKLQEQNAELVVKEDGEVAEGDTAVIDFEGFVDGEAFEGGKAENHELEIGSNSFIPGFEEQLVGMKPGEEKDVKVTFPENYQAENLAGKEATFKVKLHEIKQ